MTIHLFPIITGAMFARSIRNARTEPNAVRAAINEQILTMTLCTYCQRYAAAECGATFKLLPKATADVVEAKKLAVAKLSTKGPARRAMPIPAALATSTRLSPARNWNPGCVAFVKAA